MFAPVMKGRTRQPAGRLWTWRAAAGVMFLFVLAAPTTAQQAERAEHRDFERVNPRPIDQRVEDVNPLARSLRRLETGLEQPARFEDVYRLSDGRYMRVNGALHAVFPQSVYTDDSQQSAARVPPGTVFHIGPPTPFESNAAMRNDGARRLGQRHPSSVMLGDAHRLMPMANLRWNTFAGSLQQSAEQPAASTSNQSRPGSIASDNQNPNAASSPPLQFGDTSRPARRETGDRSRAARHGNDGAPRIWNDRAYRAERMRELMREAVTAKNRNGQSPDQARQ